jgi:hypothetical protein
MNFFYPETGDAGTRNGKTGRYIAGNGRYPGGTLCEMEGRTYGQKQYAEILMILWQVIEPVCIMTSMTASYIMPECQSCKYCHV